MAKQPTLILHPLSFVRMLWKRKVLVVITWMVLSGAGIAVVGWLPEVYRAESLILVDSQKIPERYVASTVEVSLEEHLSTISQQILSSTQLEKLIKKFDLYPKLRMTKSPEQVIGRMRDDVDITPEPGLAGAGRPGVLGAFRVAYQGPDPKVVADVVNEISRLFIAENLRTRELRAEGTSQFIENQLEEARKNLEKQEANLSRFKMERMGELPEQEAALIGTLGRLHSELQGNQDAINRAEQNKIMLENTLRLAEASESAVSRTIQQLSSATAQAVGVEGNQASGTTGAPTTLLSSEVLQNRLDALRLRYHDEYPEVKRAKSELEAALKREAQERAAAAASAKTAKENPAEKPAPRPTRALTPAMAAEINRERERVATTKTQLSVAEKELQDRIADRQRILKSIAEYQAKVERLPMREQEMASITRDYEISKQNYKSLLDKKNSAEMAMEMERRQQAERFTLQDPARVPTKPVKPNRPVMRVGAVVLGLALGLVLAVGLEFRKNRFLGEWELPPSVQVLGRIPLIEPVN